MGDAKNHNAAASAFGWEFQVNAATVLFIRNLPEAASVIVEGACDDIEINLVDGKCILCQSKSYFGNDFGTGASSRFKDSLDTLKGDCELEKCVSCLYVTNDHLPFGKSKKGNLFGSDSLLRFSELAPETQAYIVESCERHDIDRNLFTGKFGVFVLSYYGSDDRTRRESVRKAIEDFLAGLDLGGITINANKLRSVWGLLLQENATHQNLKISLDKADFVWPIVVQMCTLADSDTALDNLEEDVREEVCEAYSDLIDDASQRFTLVAKVSADFDSFRKFKGVGKLREDRKSFIDEHYEDYYSDIGADAFDGEVAEALSRMVLHKILFRLVSVDKIRKAVNLAY